MSFTHCGLCAAEGGVSSPSIMWVSGTQGIRLGGSCLFQLSHPTSPIRDIFLNLRLLLKQEFPSLERCWDEALPGVYQRFCGGELSTGRA